MNPTLAQEDIETVEVNTESTNALALAVLDRLDYFLENEWDTFLGDVSLAIVIGGTILLLRSLYQIDLSNDVVNNLQLAALGALSIPGGVSLIGYVQPPKLK